MTQQARKAKTDMKDSSTAGSPVASTAGCPLKKLQIIATSSRHLLIATSFSVMLVSYFLSSWFHNRSFSKTDSSEISSPHHKWKTDNEFYLSSKSNQVSCDLPILQAKQFERRKETNLNGLMNHPFIIRGMMATWPANERWLKSNLSMEYGSRSVQLGSESSIVYGGGSAGLKLTLDEILADVNNVHSGDDGQNNSTLGEAGGVSDNFIFDVSILDSIPEMTRDFRVPGLFRHWDNIENTKKRITWHILSLGSSRRGLAFHHHGETWLGLVHGMKRWFLYPPGASAPPSIERTHNPLETVLYWFYTVYPKMGHLDPPPINGDIPVAQGENHDGYRPLECVQMSGDIMYVPSGWSHQTLNIGDAIGIGGQTAIRANKRMTSSMNILRGSPNNFNALKGLGLSLSLLAIEEENRILDKILATSKGVVQISLDNIENIVMKGEDTWIIRFNKFGSANSKNLANIWNDLAARFEGLASVGAMDMQAAYTDGEISRDYRSLFERMGINFQKMSQDPIICLFPGRPISTESAFNFKDEVPWTRMTECVMPDEDKDINLSMLTAFAGKHMGIPMDQSTIAELSDSNAHNQYMKRSHEKARLAILLLNGHDVVDMTVGGDGSCDGNDGQRCMVDENDGFGDFVSDDNNDESSDNSNNNYSNKNESNSNVNDDFSRNNSNKKSDRKEIKNSSGITSGNSSRSSSSSVLLEKGSAVAGGAKSRRLLLRAMQLLRRSLSVQPVHPEALGLLGEVYGHLNEIEAMKKHMSDAADRLQNLDRRNLSTHSLASAYHKLATSFMSIRREHAIHAIPLLEKSLQIFPSFAPALVDRSTAYLMVSNYEKCEEAITALELIYPTHESIRSLRAAISNNRGKAHKKASKKVPV